MDVHEKQFEGMRGFPGTAEPGEALAAGRFTDELFAGVRSVPLSVAAARQGSPRSDWPPVRRHEPRKRRRPYAAVMHVETSAAQDVRTLPARPVGASSGPEPPVRVPAFVRGAGPLPSHVAERVRCPRGKIVGAAGRHYRAETETRVGRTLRLA